MFVELLSILTLWTFSAQGIVGRVINARYDYYYIDMTNKRGCSSGAAVLTDMTKKRGRLWSYCPAT